MAKSFRVLVAEDSGTVRDILCYLLQENGYETREATDGLQAVQEILRDPPDLVLLDVDMPKMNGYQVCRLVKADRRTQDLPIVMLTSRDRALDRMWGMSTGADAYLVKALDTDAPFGDLGEVLERCLAGRRPRPPLENAAELTGDEVLARLSSVLDERLFFMTLRGRVGELAHSLQSLDETVGSIFAILEQAAAFSGGALLLLRSGEEARIWLTAGKEVSETALEGLAEGAVEHLTEKLKVPVGTRPIERTHLARGEGCQGLAQVAYIPLTARKTCIGLVALGFVGTPPLDPAARETLQRLLDHASLILDNAQLYATLDSTNRELQRTLDELTSTQNQLAETEARVEELQIIIDQGKKEAKVAEIVGSDYFQAMKDRVRKLRGEG